MKDDSIYFYAHHLRNHGHSYTLLTIFRVLAPFTLTFIEIIYGKILQPYCESLYFTTNIYRIHINVLNLLFCFIF